MPLGIFSNLESINKFLVLESVLQRHNNLKDIGFEYWYRFNIFPTIHLSNHFKFFEYFYDDNYAMPFVGFDSIQ